MKNFLFFVLFFHSTLLSEEARQIIITIDDHPMQEGPLFTLTERTDRYLAAFNKFNCKAVFFCIGDACQNQEAQNSLSKIDREGHFLANHSMTHQKLSAISLQEFKEELIEMDELLSVFENSKKWFRFPYLDYGNIYSLGGSLKKSKQALSLLEKLSYINAYVTINTFDWHINERLKQAVKKGDVIDYAALRKIYLNLIEEWSLFYIDTLKNESLGPHILLLHANDLNALYMEDLLQMFTDKGWKVVSPELGFEDKSFSHISKLGLLKTKPPSLNIQAIDALLFQNN